MRQADSRRLDRLAGDGNSEAGINLASLFRVILDIVQDSADGMDEEAFIAPVQGEVSNHARVEHWYGAHAVNPWHALITDALEQLESRKILAQKGRKWRTGPAFATGKRLVVVPARKGKHGDVGVIPLAADERETLAAAEKKRMEVTSLAASLRPDGPGLRPLDAAHVAVLEQSMRDYGYRPEFPVLVDRKGRILDGRHRIAAARRAGVEVPAPRPIPIDSDEEAVGFAILVNLQRGWSDAERKRINRDLQAAGLTLENFGRQLGTAAKRELIVAALREHSDWPHYKIAKMLGVGQHQVERVCDEEVSQRLTSQCTHRATGQGARNDLARESSGSRKADSPELLDRHENLDETVGRLREQGMTQKEIAAATGTTFNQVQDSYQRLEGEHRGKSKASPPAAASQQQPAPRQAASGASPKPSSLTKVMERIGRMVSRWLDAPPDRTSELEELEALQREIAERIAELRR